MSYPQLFSALGYTALRFGLLAEMLAVKALGDAAGSVHRGCAALLRQGERQLEMLEGGVE